MAVENNNAADPRAFVKQSENGDYRLELLVRGAKCAGCLGKIEGGVGAISGIKTSRLNLSTGRFVANWDNANIDARQIVQKIVDLGYGAIPFQSEIAETQKDLEARELLIAMAVAGVATMFVMMFSEPIWISGKSGEMGIGTITLFHWLSAIVAIPAGAFAGQVFFKSAWASIKKGHANMDVPISLALILTAFLSIYATINKSAHAFFDAIVMLEFFLLIGRYLDHRLRQKSRIAAQELLALQAVTAQRLNKDDSITSVSVSNVAPNDVLVVLPGDRIPVDGIITQGTSQADFSMINGETTAVLVGEGAILRAGVLNLTGQLLLRATKSSDDSFISEIARLVEAGEQSKGLYVRLADKAAQLYVPIVHTVALLTFLGWWIVGQSIEQAIWNACAVLIITCPCALGLAVPAVQIVASGRLFKSGVLVKSGDALEKLAIVNRVVFDKTGVLTMGRPSINNRDEIPDEIFAKAAILARASRHPLSRAIVRLAGAGPMAKDAIETPGQGIEAEIEGEIMRMGRASWLGAKTQIQSDTELWFKCGNSAPVRFGFDDKIRDDAQTTIRAIKAMGIKVEILSGDRQAAVERVAKLLEIDEYRAEQSPFDKAARLDSLAQLGEKVLMVGDGLNDAPALAKALVSIAPSAAADASQSAADLVFQGELLDPVKEAIVIGRLSRKRILENFWFSAIYNVITVPLAVMGMVTPQIASIAMSTSSIAVSLNALRLYQIRSKK